jgi:hypothetical protein
MITYGTEERPPAPVVLMLATQQVMVLSIFLFAPVQVARAAHLQLDQATNFISLTTFALGISTLLQVRRWGPAAQCLCREGRLLGEPGGDLQQYSRDVIRLRTTILERPHLTQQPLQQADCAAMADRIRDTRLAE